MLNINNTRNLLQAFDFKTLFIEELGWNNPVAKTKKSREIEIFDAFFEGIFSDLHT